MEVTVLKKVFVQIHNVIMSIDAIYHNTLMILFCSLEHAMNYIVIVFKYVIFQVWQWIYNTNKFQECKQIIGNMQGIYFKK